jgi:hypothetical protein
MNRAIHPFQKSLQSKEAYLNQFNEEFEGHQCNQVCAKTESMYRFQKAA